MSLPSNPGIITLKTLYKITKNYYEQIKMYKKYHKKVNEALKKHIIGKDKFPLF